MTLFKFNKRLLVSLLAIVLVSCANPWDDRKDIDDANLRINLTEAISNTNETSQFGQLLVQTGYDKVLEASKMYTVFVPTNEAMDQVDDAILNDPEALKQFVANHIALTAYSSVRNSEETQIKMYSNKYLIFKGSTVIDDATIVTADHYAANGVFHIINKPLAIKLNIWQYINSDSAINEMTTYLKSLKEFSIYASDIAAKANAAPGFLADSLSNSYLRNVYNLNNEKNSYTLFLMEDAGYNAEVDKMKPYLIKPSNDPDRDSTAIYAKYFTLRDMAFPKKYELDQLPATLTSRFGVEVPIDKTQIVGEPIRLSNGIIYIMKKVEVSLEKRLLTTKIEGEKNIGYLGTRTPILYRDKIDPLGIRYNDIMMQNPTTGSRAKFTLLYNAKDMYSTTYKVYWRAINDRVNVVAPAVNPFQQQLGIGGTVQLISGTTNVAGFTKLFPLTAIPFNNYEEIPLGEFSMANAGNIDLISLIGGTTVATSSLTLDYLKFVPVLK